MTHESFAFWLVTHISPYAHRFSPYPTPVVRYIDHRAYMCSGHLWHLVQVDEHATRNTWVRRSGIAHPGGDQIWQALRDNPFLSER